MAVKYHNNPPQKWPARAHQQAKRISVKDAAQKASSAGLSGHLIHDMNNSLMLIDIATDELERMAQGVPSRLAKKGHQDPAEIVRRAIKEISAMLKDAEKAASDRAVMVPELEKMGQGKLAHVLQTQTAGWRLIMPPKSELSIEIEPFTGALVVSEIYLSRILHNLVRNACEAYRRQGGAPDKLKIALKGWHMDTMFCLRLSDNGPGVDAALAPHLFKAGITSKQGAIRPAGYGLTAAQGLAHVMDGNLTCDMTCPQGSTFVLILPYQSD